MAGEAQRWRVRVALQGPDRFDVDAFLPGLFGAELGHLEATFLIETPGVVATVRVSAPDAESARRYVEGRITDSFRTRGLDWITSVIAVDPEPSE